MVYAVACSLCLSHDNKVRRGALLIVALSFQSTPQALQAPQECGASVSARIVRYKERESFVIFLTLPQEFFVGAKQRHIALRIGQPSSFPFGLHQGAPGAPQY